MAKKTNVNEEVVKEVLDLRSYSVEEFAELIGEDAETIRELRTTHSKFSNATRSYSDAKILLEHSKIKSSKQEIIAKFLYTNINKGSDGSKHRFYNIRGKGLELKGTINVNEKEIKEMKTSANTFKAGSKVTSGRLTVSHLLKTINNSKYNSISDIIGDCEAVIERYEYGVGVTHSDNTFVYSMRSENPEAEDIQPSDKVWGYVKLFVRIIKDSTEQYTSLTVYEDNFDRFATSLMAVLNIDNTYEAASLRTLLNDAVASGTRVPIARVKKESYTVTYWARYTHQPKYKLDYTLHSTQNAALFEEAFCNALYYPALEYNTVYKVKIDNCYIQHKVLPITKYDHITKKYITVEEDTVTRFLLKLVSDEGYVYRIDTQIDIAIDKTLESLCAAAALPEELEDIDDVSDLLIGRKFLFSVMLDYSETTQTQYEIFAFGKEVK